MEPQRLSLCSHLERELGLKTKIQKTIHGFTERMVRKVGEMYLTESRKKASPGELKALALRDLEAASIELARECYNEEFDLLGVNTLTDKRIIESTASYFENLGYHQGEVGIISSYNSLDHCSPLNKPVPFTFLREGKTGEVRVLNLRIPKEDRMDITVVYNFSVKDLLSFP